MGLADEPGSGMRNTYKYTRLYSGAEPQFVEGDIFRTIIPLSEAATATVEPTSVSIADATTEVTTEVSTEVSTEVDTEVNTEVNTEVKLQSEKLIALLNYCETARSRKEMQEFCGIKTAEYFRKHIIKPMLTEELIKQTIPDKPNSPNQKYVKA